MLRHYSTCRISVLSLVLPICVALLGVVVSIDRNRSLATYLLIAEGLLFIYAVVLSMFFSIKYEQTRRLLVRLEAGEDVSIYSTAVSARLRDHLEMDGIDRSVISLGIILHLAFYLYYILK